MSEFDAEAFYVPGEEQDAYHEYPVPDDELEPVEAEERTEFKYAAHEDVEQAVLAIILDRPEALNSIDSSRFNEELFTGPRFHIAQAIKSLVDSEVVPDFVSIAIRLEMEAGILFERWGGRTFLRELTQHVPYGDYTFPHFFDQLEDALRRRQLYDLSDIAKGLASDQSKQSVESVLDLQSNLVDILATTNRTSSFVSLEEASNGLIDQILERSQTQPGELIGLSTGFRDVDYYLKGLKPGKMYIVAARPGAGKSGIALNIAARAAIDENVPVLFFSLEMGANEIAERLISARARVPFVHIADGSLSENDWANIAKAKRDILQSPLYIEDSPSTTVQDIRSRCQTIHAAKGSIGLIVIDYIQLMTGIGGKQGRGNRQELVADISRNIKILSKDFNCPVIALSQLNRNLEERADKRPLLSDLRESGAIEQDADVVSFLYRDETYYAASANQGITEFIVAKNRSGESGTARLAFLNQFVEFATLAKV